MYMYMYFTHTFLVWLSESDKLTLDIHTHNIPQMKSLKF